MPDQRRKVAVIGAGIAGLASAHFLLNAGYTPVVFEAADRLGGLGTYFEHRDTQLDCFYHVILESDSELRRLIGDLGLADRLTWRQTGMGFYLGGTLYGLNAPLDLLKFRALPLADRLRTGLGVLYVTKIKRSALDLDEVFARDWLRGIFGPRVFGSIWEPLLRAKFGERLDTVPAYWVWNTLAREKNGKKEVKGYLKGGYQTLVEALQQSIVSSGGEVRLECPVTALEANGSGVSVDTTGTAERFEAAVSTLPLPLLASVARGDLATAVPLADLDYQGVVNAVILSRNPLERFYWTIVVDPSFPFQGVVETTHVIPSEWVGNRHLIYVMNYCQVGSEPYTRSDDLIKRQAVDGLQALYPRFNVSDVEDVCVFRAPYVEPVWSVGYLHKRPGSRVGDTRLYISTTAQAYPRVTAWNTSVTLARETVTALAQDLNHAIPRARAA